MSKPAATDQQQHGSETVAQERARPRTTPNGPASLNVNGNSSLPVAQGIASEAAAVDAFEVLEALAGSIEAPEDWAAEHDHYLYGTPKRGKR